MRWAYPAPVRFARGLRYAAQTDLADRVDGMAIFSVEYRYTDNTAGRDAHRAEHREYLGSQAGILLSGPLAEPDGALIIVSAESADAVAQMLDADPFAREGLIAQRVVRPYKPVLGSLISALD